jgi:hypothetical protein
MSLLGQVGLRKLANILIFGKKPFEWDVLSVGALNLLSSLYFAFEKAYQRTCETSTQDQTIHRFVQIMYKELPNCLRNCHKCCPDKRLLIPPPRTVSMPCPPEPRQADLKKTPTIFSGFRRPENPEFPWNIRLPPCQRQVNSFADLEARIITRVPELLEPFNLTYRPGNIASDDRGDRHRLLRTFVEEYGKESVFYLLRLEKLGMPRALVKELMIDENCPADVPGQIFLMSLYPAFAKVYCRTHHDAKEDDIVEDFGRIYLNKFPRCVKDCVPCMMASVTAGRRHTRSAR